MWEFACQEKYAALVSSCLGRRPGRAGQRLWDAGSPPCKTRDCFSVSDEGDWQFRGTTSVLSAFSRNAPRVLLTQIGRTGKRKVGVGRRGRRQGGGAFVYSRARTRSRILLKSHPVSVPANFGGEKRDGRREKGSFAVGATPGPIAPGRDVLWINSECEPRCERILKYLCPVCADIPTGDGVSLSPPRPAEARGLLRCPPPGIESRCRLN